MPHVHTVLGPRPVEELCPMLIHEHVMCDFIGAAQTGKHRYDPDEVVASMTPYLQAVAAQGIKGFVDCTPMFIGRDPLVLRRLSEATGVAIVTNTGLYKEPFLPEYAFAEPAEALADRWMAEWADGIEGTDIRPGFIKIALNPGPLIPIQRKIVQAAALAHRTTGLTIAAHSGSGIATLEAIDVLQSMGVEPGRFIFVHADSEPDRNLHNEAAKRGAWVEYDAIGYRPISEHVELIRWAAECGLLDHLLISQDAGWYRVGEPGGGQKQSYSALVGELVPRLPEEWVVQLLHVNPARALAGGLIR